MRTNAIRMVVVSVLVAAGMHSRCLAYADTWSRVLGTGCNVQTAKTTAGLFGVDPSAYDSYDPLDRAIPADYDLYAATYRDSTEDQVWAGPSGFYRRDLRTPINAGQSKTWTVYVWATPTLSMDAAYIALDFGYNAGIPDGLSFTLAFRSKPAGITGGPAVGTVWDLSEQPYGVQLPVFRTTNGLEGYAFEFTATAIPEPSSLLALLAGLGGLGGMMWRRRR